MKETVRPGCEVMGERLAIDETMLLHVKNDEDFLKFMKERLNEELMNNLFQKIEDGPIAVCYVDDMVHSKDASDEMIHTLTRHIHYRPLILCKDCEYFIPEGYHNVGTCTKCKEYLHALDGCTHGKEKFGCKVKIVKEKTNE